MECRHRRIGRLFGSSFRRCYYISSGVHHLETGSALVVAAGRARVADDDHASALAAGGSDGHVDGLFVGVGVVDDGL